MAEINQKWRDLFGSEVEYIFRLGSCFNDPEQKKAFWETVKEKKTIDSRWSIYDMFPTTENARERAAKKCCEFVKSLRIPRRDEEDDMGKT